MQFHEHSSYDGRLASYDRVNDDVIVKLMSDSLSRAGFYYSGDGASDEVTCFACGIHLKSWDMYHDPWSEHVCRSPSCVFLLLAKGRTFINRVYPNTFNSCVKVLLIQKIKIYNMLNVECGENNDRVHLKYRVYGKNQLIRDRQSNNLSKLLINESMRMNEVHYSNNILCKICFVETLEVAFMACGHAVSCVQCVVLLDKCPICRVSFWLTIRFFIPSTDDVNNNNWQRSGSLTKRNNTKLICSVCQSREVAVIFLPCKHTYSCEECIHKIDACDICFRTVRAFAKIYFG